MIYFAVIDIAGLNNMSLEQIKAKLEKKEYSPHEIWCWALRTGRLDCIEYLNSSIPFSLGAIEIAAEHGYIDIIKWLYDNRPEYYSGEALANAAGKGHLELVKWLFNNRPYEASSLWTDDNIKIALDRAMYSGYLDVVKWLYYNNTTVFSEEILTIYKQKYKYHHNKSNTIDDKERDIKHWLFDETPLR